MSLLCKCGQCLVRDMNEGRGPVPFCFRDTSDSFRMIELIFQEAAERGQDFSIQRIISRDREETGRPADPRDEWREHIAALLAEFREARTPYHRSRSVAHTLPKLELFHSNLST